MPLIVKDVKTFQSGDTVHTSQQLGTIQLLDNMTRTQRLMNTSNAKTGRGFQRFSSITKKNETEIELKQHQQQSHKDLNIIHNIQNVSKKGCYVAEDFATGLGDAMLSKDKNNLDIKHVSSKHSAYMELEDDRFIQNGEFPESDVDTMVNEGASCVCKCHCRRNFQRHGLTKKSKLKSTKYDRSEDKLLYDTQRNATIGVIKVIESNHKPRLFRTRLKSENCSERLNVGISDKRYINLLCLRIRSSMAKVLCHCVILLLLCLCGVVMVHQNIGKADNELIHSVHTGAYKQDSIITTPESSIIMDLPFRSVSKDDFEKHLAKSTSAAEMLKIFFSDPSLTEEQVNSIMYMKKHQKYYGSKSKGTNRMMREEEYDRNYREIAYQHYLQFERSPFSDCSVPKPEIVRIEDTFSDSVRYYLPSCTVVNRCSNTTACCPRGYVCAPKRENGIELIDKFFMVLERVPGTDDLRPAKDLIAAKTIINHTACECQKVDVNTNCHKECPLQFTRRRPGADCDCICASGHRKCHKIHKGLLPLDEKDLECIKEDRCIVPSCHSGTFSISTGFCPHFRRHRG